MTVELASLIRLVLAALQFSPLGPMPILLLKVAELLRHVNPENLKRIEETLNALKPLVFTVAILMGAIAFAVAYIVHAIEGIGW